MLRRLRIPVNGRSAHLIRSGTERLFAFIADFCIHLNFSREIYLKVKTITLLSDGVPVEKFRNQFRSESRAILIAAVESRRGSATARRSRRRCKVKLIFRFVTSCPCLLRRLQCVPLVSGSGRAAAFCLSRTKSSQNSAMARFALFYRSAEIFAAFRAIFFHCVPSAKFNETNF